MASVAKSCISRGACGKIFIRNDLFRENRKGPEGSRAFSVWVYFYFSRAGKLVRQWEIDCFVWLMLRMGLTRMEARPTEVVRWLKSADMLPGHR